MYRDSGRTHVPSWTSWLNDLAELSFLHESTPGCVFVYQYVQGFGSSVPSCWDGRETKDRKVLGGMLLKCTFRVGKSARWHATIAQRLRQDKPFYPEVSLPSISVMIQCCGLCLSLPFLLSTFYCNLQTAWTALHHTAPADRFQQPTSNRPQHHMHGIVAAGPSNHSDVHAPHKLSSRCSNVPASLIRCQL